MDGFSSDYLMSLLQQSHKVAPALKVETVSIKDIQKLTSDGKYEKELTNAKERLQGEIKFTVEKSYDCNYLHSTVLSKIREAQTKNELTISLENRCCTLDTCPEMTLMKYVIEELKQ